MRKICLALWLAMLVVGIGILILAPSQFSAENLAGLMLRFGGMIWAVYLGLSVLRGFTLLPSTPLVIAGTLIFPDQSLSVFCVSMIGIIFSSSLIYFFSENLGFADYFEGHKPELTQKLRARLEHPFGVVFVGLWAFFPFVPTDLVCYLAGTTKMKYLKFITAVALGEAILCYCYVFLGSSLIDMLR